MKRTSIIYIYYNINVDAIYFHTIKGFHGLDVGRASTVWYII